MSYDLRIWEQPAGLPEPVTLGNACECYRTLNEKQAPVNPKFIALARQLVAHYPSQNPSNPDDDVWVGDLIGQASSCDQAIFAFSLPPVNRLGLIRLVVDEATALGLTVFDDQIAMAFLPSGKVLPEVHAAAWAQMKRDMDAAPKPKTKAQMRKHVEAQFLQAFGSQGFKVVKPEHCEIQLRRKTDEGHQDIRLFVKGSGSEFTCSVFFSAVNERVIAIFESYAVKGQTQSTAMRLRLNDFIAEPYGGYPVSSPEEIKSLLDAIQTHVMPILDLMCDARGLDQLFHGESPKIRRNSLFWSNQNVHLIALVSAYLVANPRFDELVAGYLKRYEDSTDQFAERVEQLVGHLRAHVKPLA